MRWISHAPSPVPPTGRGDAASGGTLGLQEPSYDAAKRSRVLAFDDRQPGPGWSALSAAPGHTATSNCPAKNLPHHVIRGQTRLMAQFVGQRRDGGCIVL